jgi:hypothetical protein
VFALAGRCFVSACVAAGDAAFFVARSAEWQTRFLETECIRVVSDPLCGLSLDCLVCPDAWTMRAPLAQHDGTW